MKTFSIEDNEHLEKIIRSCKICYVGMADKSGKPYVLPMNFGYENGIIYLHSAQEGRSIRIMEENPNICVTFCSDAELIYQHAEVACSYRMRAGSVICEGKVRFEDDFDEKVKALDIIMRQYAGEKKFNFSTPAVNNVKIWILKIDFSCTKEFGTRRPGIISYKDRDQF